MLTKDAKIYVAGHRGLAGSAIVRRLQSGGYDHFVTRTHAELDLIDGSAVRAFFERESPTHVFVAAAKVGGIMANDTYPAEFIHQNLAIEINVVHEAWRAGVQRLIMLGSSCIYPRECPQPMRESFLLTGPLEKTNRPYAVAKIAGIEMCWSYNRQYSTDFIAVMPTNLYGPGDNYDLQTSHVLPALIRKMHEAKERGDGHVELWGTGSPKREFLHSEDMADACVHIAELSKDALSDLVASESDPPLVNIGCGEDLSIRALAEMIADVVGFSGELRWDPSKPDGTPRKLMDISRLKSLGWSPKIGLREGIARTYEAFRRERQ